MKRRGSSVLPLAGAWALAFGCAVGWDSFVLPWTEFLPMAGPLGTAIGVLLGALVMAIVAWNFHVMTNRFPGPGSVYSYASEVFGPDHGFLCGWFLSFTYMAIVWLDATVLGVAASFAFGDVLRVGPHYVVNGFDVYLTCMGVSVVAIAAAAAICCRRRLARTVQLLFALVFLAGIFVCFLAALRRGGGFSAMKPPFATAPGAPSPLGQILSIVALAPWLFIGFETVSIVSGGLGFPVKRSFLVMMSALAAAVAAYALLAGIPALAPGDDASNWVSTIAQAAPTVESAAFATAARPLGPAGKPFVLSLLFAAIFTNLVGNTIAAARLLGAMAADGALPPWLGRTSPSGVPRNAVLSIAVLSIFIIALGNTAISVMVDLALVGAALAYAYTSAAAHKTARADGSRLTRATGLVGLVLSVVIILLYVLPAFTSATSLISTQSYLVIVLWCLAGLVAFLAVFRHDRTDRFGRTPIAWIGLLAVVFFMVLLWIRESTLETTKRAFDGIVAHHATLHAGEETPAAPPGDSVAVVPGGDWRDALAEELDGVNRTILRHNFVQTALAVLAFALMIRLYSILRRREHEHELEKARAKSYFFSTVSHDIRTPLNAIIGFSEILKAGPQSNGEREQAVEAILVSGRTLLGLVNDVLDLSKLESGKMEILPEPTDCGRLLNAVMDAFRVTGNKPGLELRCRVGAMPPLMLDPQRLRQIVFNLVGNAVKFTERGHVELRAAYEREGRAEEGVFRLEVEDTGCGIDGESLKHIGSAYVQLGSKRGRNGGTGLGLAICKQLAAAMGGRLAVESSVGRGSTFSVTIPGVREAVAGEGGAEGETPPRGSAAVRGGTGKPVKRILLVDDSKLNLMVLKALLKHLGDFEIGMAGNGREGLAMLAASGGAPFDLVLTDLWMPDVDGKELVQAIRKNPALAGLRVIAVTADVEFLETHAEFGFDGVLLKPVTPEKLRKILAGEG